MKWNKKQTEYLIKNYSNINASIIAEKLNKNIYSVYNKANYMGLKKSQEFIKEIAKKNFKSKKNQFVKGHIPFNKGKKQIEYLSPEMIERCKIGRFQRWNQPHNTVPVLTINQRKDKSGKMYSYIKLANGKWQLYQRYVWEQHNGKIPKSHLVVFKDGNTQNFKLENLECISKSENMNRNSFHRFTPELKTAIRRVNKIKKIIT